MADRVTVRCKLCGATGARGEGYCPSCKGTGYVVVVPGANGASIACALCGGSGVHPRDPKGICPGCGGSGWAGTERGS